MPSVPFPSSMLLLSDVAPGTPVDAAVGLTWIPYVVVGVGLMLIAAVSRVRSRHREAAVREFLLQRGASLLLLGVAVLWLADAAAEGDGLTAADRPIWSWLVDHRTSALTAAAKVVTEVGSTATMGVVGAAAAGWLAFRARRRSEAILVATVTVGAGLLVTVSKPIVGRVRPPEEFRLVPETNQSFPSGHAVASIAVIGVLLVVFLPRLRSSGGRASVGGLATLFVVAIGLSRLYLGVHWPTDVAGGWLTGGGWLLACVTAHTVWRRCPEALHRRRRGVGDQAGSGSRPIVRRSV